MGPKGRCEPEEARRLIRGGSHGSRGSPVHHLPRSRPLALRVPLPHVWARFDRAYPCGGSHRSRGGRSAKSQPVQPREVSAAPMKKGSRSPDDLRPGYDLASLGPGMRGKYAQRLKGTTLVALQPEVAEAFPTSEAVNEALRVVLKATTVVRRSTPIRKRIRRTHGEGGNSRLPRLSGRGHR